MTQKVEKASALKEDREIPKLELGEALTQGCYAAAGFHCAKDCGKGCATN